MRTEIVFVVETPDDVTLTNVTGVAQMAAVEFIRTVQHYLAPCSLDRITILDGSGKSPARGVIRKPYSPPTLTVLLPSDPRAVEVAAAIDSAKPR